MTRPVRQEIENPSAGQKTDVVRRLEEDIALGLLRPRQRLIEDELMLRFQAKRNAVRDALVELEAMGVVLKPRNKGAIVRDYDVREVEEIYVVRELLEGKAASLIPLPSPRRLVQALKAIHSRHVAAGKRGDLAVVFRENLSFHRTFFEACGNTALVEAIEMFQMKSHAIRSYSIANADLLKHVTKEHGTIIDALESTDREMLVRLVAGHIIPAKEAYLKIIGHTEEPA